MKKFFAALSLLLSLSTVNLFAQSTSVALKNSKTEEWFNKKDYLNGLSATPHASIDKMQFFIQYNLNKELWDKAFTYLKETNLQTLTNGRHVIDGDNVYAIVTEAPSKDYDKTAFEAHRKYIDLQYVITGEENMGKAPLGAVTVNRPYNENADIGYYTGEGQIYSVPQNNFMVFFPSDAHRPNITPGGNKIVKKIVIKIKLAETKTT
jgi:YhcH/YjgK/YiaL family protein